MAVRAQPPAARRRAPASRAGLRLVVFHTSPEVGTHIAPLRRSRKFRVDCYPQRPMPSRTTLQDAHAVLWELTPDDRPNWRQLKAVTQGMPLVSYSAAPGVGLADRSRAIGFACHLSAPLNAAEVEHQLALASPSDLATRLERSQPMLRRFVGRVDVMTDLHRSVNESLEPARVADALAARAAAWLPAESWAVVASAKSGGATVLAERSLAANAEVAARAVGAWVIDHSRDYVARSLKDDPSLDGAPDVATIALPLMCRGRTVAALVGVDREPSAQLPRLSQSLRAALQRLLEPAAFALDNAFRMQRAEELSVTDDLTQLHNSRYLSQALRREAKRASRSGQPLSLLFLDLDGFKGINDQHGHLNGSQALVEVAKLIRSCSRESDIAARFGGDEFAVVLPDTGDAGALAVATRIHERVRDHVFLQPEGINYRLTVSVGVATMPGVVSSVEALLPAADEAMYWVKANGKNGVRLAGARSREGMSA